MAVNDNGTKAVVFGGMLDNNAHVAKKNTVGFNYSSSVGSTALYNIGLNQMIYSYTPPASYIKEDATATAPEKSISLALAL